MISTHTRGDYWSVIAGYEPCGGAEVKAINADGVVETGS